MSTPGTRDAILRVFRQRKGQFISGEEISQTLGVSRTAVWKHIGLLRKQGYGIESAASRGYRLTETPDTLIPAEIQANLGTDCVGREVIHFEETESTNRIAHEYGKAGAEEGLVIIAEQQTAGKGRLGRPWISPAGVNLYTSILLRPSILPRWATQLTFLSSVAVARAIEAVSGLQPQVKWPNDVLIDGKKVAGILNEIDAEMEGIHYLVMGIGVNLNMTADQFPDDLRYPATSLALEAGRDFSRLTFARTLYRGLDDLYRTYLQEGFRPIAAEWNLFFAWQGKEVEVDFQDRRLQGTVTGIDTDGALLLRLHSGATERVLAGDVRPL
ncbi:biotin--[acetyl-CoA-carboxylase] ligase [Desulfuromonas sp. AOP6]|uniref:biotin--[acetyl-CoA-carboxylase] ligase n=1 Tax=Desulfuromonas sp. AOP6 TaxID=1566351 RepID=UPI00127AE7FA|nr:biotin--[acetyl-CoA-carboxylase] ligase [Desulfuromonas sp. AOP6]BCA79238.1 bifunctional ligase/repressor BirA [Desulfuromonas sp. AOP6]